jgi:hypothetical protein
MRKPTIMSFKENISKKIKIKQLAIKANSSIGPSGSEKKVDKATMRQLLQLANYKIENVRDLELYLSTAENTDQHILVLDNEVAIYQTTIEDVTLRKSPTLKEMLNIPNAIKIINDSNVILAKREASVAIVKKAGIEQLDLSFTKDDINALVLDGIAAVENYDAEGILEIISLFAEILDYIELPKITRIGHCRLFGKAAQTTEPKKEYDPIIIFSQNDYSIKWINGPLSLTDTIQLERLYEAANNITQTAIKGAAVFQKLAEKVGARI